MAADHGEIAGSAVAAATGATPHRPPRLIARRCLGRLLQHRRIGMGNVGRQGIALRRKAERRAIGAANPVAPVDEGIEHLNWSVSWKATFCAPVAGSPESWS